LSAPRAADPVPPGAREPNPDPAVAAEITLGPVEAPEIDPLAVAAPEIGPESAPPEAAVAPQSPDGRAEPIDLSFGPRHPAIQGVLRLRLTLDGETVTGCEPLIGFGHRGLEKLFESYSLRDGVALTDRLDFVAAAAANLAYAGTVERLLGLAVPARARFLRVTVAELSRVASHLLWLSTHAEEGGTEELCGICLRHRERILDLLEELCGARLTLRCAIPGGLPRDATGSWVERCAVLAAALPAWIDGYEERLTEDRAWKKRTVGLGVLSPETALEYGVSGPILRASGVDWDLRKALPYDAYAELEFEVPVRRNGDAYDRYLVRVAEMRQSARLIGQTLARLPTGPVLPAGIDPGGSRPAASPVPEVEPAGPRAEAYFSVEGPRGEIGFYIALAGNCTAGGADAVGRGCGRVLLPEEASPWRCRARTPSLRHLQVLPEIAAGHRVSDLVMLLGSLDLALGEVDR
jgi:NADH-quinone oxidoreductase subunit D